MRSVNSTYSSAQRVGLTQLRRKRCSSPNPSPLSDNASTHEGFLRGNVPGQKNIGSPTRHHPVEFVTVPSAQKPRPQQHASIGSKLFHRSAIILESWKNKKQVNGITIPRKMSWTPGINNRDTVSTDHRSCLASVTMRRGYRMRLRRKHLQREINKSLSKLESSPATWTPRSPTLLE